MSRSYSSDLRERVVGAIEGGLSCREAARNYGIGVSSAIRWMQRYRRTGSFQAYSQGGDRLSHRIERHAEFIFSLLDEQSDITLHEIQEHLQREKGASFAVSTLWRFFDRHQITYKKRQAMQQSRNVAMCKPNVPSGANDKRG